ncbi:MAG: hypothetical protein U1E36_03205 [Rickettsiales bacterium]
MWLRLARLCDTTLGMFFSKKESHSELSAPMIGLAQRLSIRLNGHAPRMITFIAARPREGTSTITRDYAEALTAQTQQKVLIIDANPAPKKVRGSLDELGIVDALVGGQPAAEAVRNYSTNVSITRWVSKDENRTAASQKIRDKYVWDTLLQAHDVILIDAPALQTSYDGVLLASQAKTAVVIVEAEKTPRGVVENLKETLQEAGAEIAGIVMNKRRFYIPKRVYKKL